jgi:hypothetical protein
MPIQAPPFYYPFNSSTWAKGPSHYDGRNQVQSSLNYGNQGRLETPRTPRRGIRKHTGQWNTPTQRRLVHFMPERWKPSTSRKNNSNVNSFDYRRLSVTKPIQVKNSTKTPEKAHIDTLRRRERRQRNRSVILENSGEFGCLNDNRFILLSETDEEGTDNDLSEAENETQAMKNNKQQKNLSKQVKQSIDTRHHRVSNNNTRQTNPTTEVPISSEHVIVINKNKQTKKERGNNQRQVFNPEIEQEFIILSDNVQGNEESSSNKDKQRTKTYLQGFKILGYLKSRMNNDRTIKLDFKDAFNEVYAYAKSTIEAYDKWIHNHYEAQVWQRFYDLGRHNDHWAKEVVNMTHTWEAKKNIVLCEKKISIFTSACFDANNIIARNMRGFSSDPSIPSATGVVKRAHDLMLDYIKEATQGLSKMSINRI